MFPYRPDPMTSPISPDNLVPALARLAAQRGFSAGWRASAGDPGQWQAAGLQLMQQLVLPDLPEPDFAPNLLAEEDRGDHIARQLRLTLTQGMEAEALLLLPKGDGPFPAALALHDHGSEFRIGKEKCIPPLNGPHPVAEGWLQRFFGGQSPGLALVRHGFAVLSVDALGWGGRQGNGYEAQQALAANLMAIGLTPAGLMAWEDKRAAAFLASLPQVDARRIGAVGFSLGGFRAWQVAALSPHVAAAVSISWMASLPGLLVPGNNQLRGQSAFWMTHPLLFRHLDLPDIAGLAAPKPLWAEVGQGDPLFPAPAVTEAFAKLAEIWQARGAEASLSLHRPSGAHSFLPDRQAEAFAWLACQLG